MPDTLTTISTFINSPPGQLAAGAVLAGMVWKFFERVEAVLTDQTKFEIAVWLVGIDATRPPKAFQEIIKAGFAYVFGKTQASFRSLFASFVLTVVAAFVLLPFRPDFSKVTDDVPSIEKTFLMCCLVFYLPLFWVIRCLRMGMLLIVVRNEGSMVRSYFVVCLQGLVSFFLVGVLSRLLAHVFAYPNERFPVYGEEWLFEAGWVVVALSTLGLIPFVLVIFVCSSLAVKAASRFSEGFHWFNRKVDLERKPLSAIGLVAGALVTLLWWTVVVVKWIV